MTKRLFAGLVVALSAASGCDGFKDALTAHVDVVASVEQRELSVTRLGDLLGNSTLQIPVNRETAEIVSNLWTGYQMLALAAARGDSVIDTTLIDEATRGISSSMRLRRFMESVNSTLTRESPSEATYNQAVGGLFAARHILFSFPGGATQEQKDSVRRRATAIRGQLTAGNFADLARRHSGDPGSKERGGDLGTFPRGDMVQAFGDAVAALQPGQISQPIETQYGYHIIQRSTYAAAKAQYDQAFADRVGQSAESAFVARVDADANISVRSSAPADVKRAALNFAAHRRDRDVLATFRNGSLTLGTLVKWVEMMPPQARIGNQIVQSPDSMVREFIRSVARNEVLLQKADSAGVRLTDEERRELYKQFKDAIVGLWGQLGLDPVALAEGGRAVPERERLASDHVESLIDRIMTGQAQAIQVPAPAHSVLALLYETESRTTGLDRAVERGSRVRASADSARIAAQPASQVPLPGNAPPAAPPAGGKQP